MALKNYKVVQEDGEETHYQIDESDPAGKEILKALETAAKDKQSPVKSVGEGEPEPINKGTSSK